MNYYAEALGDTWPLNHKVTVDPDRKLIFVSSDVIDLDIKIDVYSDYKEWFKLGNNSGLGSVAIRTIGGDNTIAGQKAGDIYFLINGWRIVYDPTKVTITGVLFSDDYDTPWLYSANLQPVFPALVASLVTGVDSADAITAAIRADQAAELANMDTSVSSRATQTSVDALAVTLAAQPQDLWDYLVTGTFPTGSAGEKLQQVLTTGNFLALK